MARRKLTVVEQATKDAAKELGLPVTHWTVERLATLSVMLAVARQRWANNQSTTAANDTIALMSEITAIRAEAMAAQPMHTTLEIVRPVTMDVELKCKHCEKVASYKVSNRPFDGGTLVGKTSAATTPHRLRLKPRPRASQRPGNSRPRTTLRQHRHRRSISMASRTVCFTRNAERRSNVCSPAFMTRCEAYHP